MEIKKNKRAKPKCDEQMGVIQFSSVTINKLKKRGFGMIYPPSKLS